MFTMTGPITVDLKPQLQMKPAEMTRLWELGILSNTAYVYLVIKYEVEAGRWRDRCHKPDGQNHHQMALTASDYNHLAGTWRGITEKNDRGDLKELTFAMIDTALAALSKKDIMAARVQQMTLFFGEETTITPSATPAED